MTTPATAKASLCRRAWKNTAIALRVLCLALLVFMLSFKFRDFLRQPVVSETNVVPASLPTITICPDELSLTAVALREEGWQVGLFTTEDVLRAAASPLECSIVGCETADGGDCLPRRATGVNSSCNFFVGSPGSVGYSSSSSSVGKGDFSEGKGSSSAPQTSSDIHSGSGRNDAGDLSGPWQSRRFPPGITCHSLRLADWSNFSTTTELILSLVLDPDTAGGNGFYRVFFHAERTPKTWYGGTLLSPYHLVHDNSFQELVLTHTETLNVNRPQRRCEPDDDYDVNQCLLDCRSAAVFVKLNCSIRWGAATGNLPPCITQQEYYTARSEWRDVKPDCDCPRPCRHHSLTLTAHSAMRGYGSMVDVQVRFDAQKLLVEERFSYTLVDLLIDLGGTFGLLLGYSLMSLIDLVNMAVTWAEGRRRRPAPGGANAASADAHEPGPNKTPMGPHVPPTGNTVILSRPNSVVHW